LGGKVLIGAFLFERADGRGWPKLKGGLDYSYWGVLAKAKATKSRAGESRARERGEH